MPEPPKPVPLPPIEDERKTARRRWGRLRQRKLGPPTEECRICGSWRDVTWDHINGLSAGNGRENLRPLCRRCNSTRQKGRHSDIWVLARRLRRATRHHLSIETVGKFVVFEDDGSAPTPQGKPVGGIPVYAEGLLDVDDDGVS